MQPVSMKGKGYCFPSYSENQPQLLMKVNPEQGSAQKQAPDPTCLWEMRLLESSKYGSLALSIVLSGLSLHRQYEVSTQGVTRKIAWPLEERCF